MAFGDFFKRGEPSLSAFENKETIKPKNFTEHLKSQARLDFFGTVDKIKKLYESLGEPKDNEFIQIKSRYNNFAKMRDEKTADKDKLEVEENQIIQSLASMSDIKTVLLKSLSARDSVVQKIVNQLRVMLPNNPILAEIESSYQAYINTIKGGTAHADDTPKKLQEYYSSVNKNLDALLIDAMNDTVSHSESFNDSPKVEIPEMKKSLGIIDAGIEKNRLHTLNLGIELITPKLMTLNAGPSIEMQIEEDSSNQEYMATAYIKEYNTELFFTLAKLATDNKNNGLEIIASQITTNMKNGVYDAEAVDLFFKAKKLACIEVKKMMEEYTGTVHGKDTFTAKFRLNQIKNFEFQEPALDILERELLTNDNKINHPVEYNKIVGFLKIMNGQELDKKISMMLVDSYAKAIDTLLYS